MQHWYESGADPKEWPQFDSEDYRCLVVWDGSGLRYYERCPFPIAVEDEFMAFGCGRDFALAAMHLGHSALKAVQVANRFDSGCGLGVDVMMLEGDASEAHRAAKTQRLAETLVFNA